MADTMTRADALRALIGRVEAGEAPHPMPLMWTLAAASGAGMDAADVARAFDGSLDAVARLEAPVLKGWWQQITRMQGEFEKDGWFLVMLSGPTSQSPRAEVRAHCPTEPRARLLAVLKALLHEEDGNGGS